MPFLQWLSVANQNECPSCGDALAKDAAKKPPHIGLQEKCLLIYYWCIVRATDSVETISKVLELDPKEVTEIYGHLKDVYSLEDLLKRIEEYTLQAHEWHDAPELTLKAQRLGQVSIAQEQDTAEERKLKDRRRRVAPILPDGR